MPDPIFSKPMKPSLVSSIVLNWNGKAVIFECIESLLTQSYDAHEIIIVDNGSTDGSLELLEKKYGKRVTIIRNGRNLGFAEGVNVGLRASQGEFITLLNSDAVASRDWVEKLVTAAGTLETIAMCASKIYLADREGILDNTGEVICRDGLGMARGRLEKDEGQYDRNKDVLCPSGCASFYRRKMLNEIGGLDKHFFLYAEDIDIGLRARLTGFTCVYVPTAVVYHKLSSSSGVVSPLKAFYVERNRLWIVLKCFPLRHLLASPYHTALRYFYYVRGMMSKKGPASHYTRRFSALSLFWVLIKAYLSTLLFLPYLLIQRIRLRRVTKWTHREFEVCLKSFGKNPREASLNELI